MMKLALFIIEAEYWRVCMIWFASYVLKVILPILLLHVSVMGTGPLYQPGIHHSDPLGPVLICLFNCASSP